MTEEQKALIEKYERKIRTAYLANYYVGLGTEQIREIFDLHNELLPNQKEVFTTCNSCVLRILKKLYRFLPELEEVEKPEAEVKKEAPVKAKKKGGKKK